MARTTKYFNMSFPQRLIQEPILFNISVKFGVEFNICQANVTDAQGFLCLALSAEEEHLTNAVEYLQQRGVAIEEIPAPVNA